MNTSHDLQPSPVPRESAAQQGGEAPGPRRAWVERAVWTDRMLGALQKGVRGNKYFEQHGLYCLTTAWGLFRQSRV
jgi:hypothetical protein